MLSEVESKDPMTPEMHFEFHELLHKFREMGFTTGYNYSVDGHYPNHEDWLKAESKGHVYLSVGDEADILITGVGNTLLDAAKHAYSKSVKLRNILG